MASGPPKKGGSVSASVTTIIAFCTVQTTGKVTANLSMSAVTRITTRGAPAPSQRNPQDRD